MKKAHQNLQVIEVSNGSSRSSRSALNLSATLLLILFIGPLVQAITSDDDLMNGAGQFDESAFRLA